MYIADTCNPALKNGIDNITSFLGPIIFIFLVENHSLLTLTKLENIETRDYDPKQTYQYKKRGKAVITLPLASTIKLCERR